MWIRLTILELYLHHHIYRNLLLNSNENKLEKSPSRRYSVFSVNQLILKDIEL